MKKILLPSSLPTLYFSMLLAIGLLSACSNDGENNSDNITVIYHVLNENGQESTVFNSGDKLMFELIIKNTTDHALKYDDWRILINNAFLTYNSNNQLYNPILTDDLVMQPVTIAPGQQFCRQLIWPWNHVFLPVGKYHSFYTFHIDGKDRKEFITNFEIQ